MAEKKRTLLWRVTVADISGRNTKELGTLDVVADDAQGAVEKTLRVGEFAGNDGFGYIYQPMATKVVLISRAI